MVSSIRNVITGVIPIEAPIPLTDCVAARGKIISVTDRESLKYNMCRSSNLNKYIIQNQFPLSVITFVLYTNPQF